MGGTIGDMDLSNSLQIVSRSDAGMVRAHNEDAIFTSAACGLAVLADGMGGYNAGEVASGMATALIGGELEKALAHTEPHRHDASGKLAAHSLIEAQVARANTEIYESAQAQPQYAGMGTTLVMGLFYDNSVTLAHIGDSRAYRVREGRLALLTRDHSLLQEHIDTGMITPEEARRSQNKNLVTRALGVDVTVEPEMRDYDCVPGDIYLFCSDGLNDMIEDDVIAATLLERLDDLEQAATNLVQLANDNGGRDNVSVILVKVLRQFPASRGLWSRVLSWFG